LRNFWIALKRPVSEMDGTHHPLFAYLLETYDLLTVAKAQTTLRYWNWSLSSAFAATSSSGPEIQEEQANEDETFSTARRTASLVFGK
jgi:hypothetical protein